MDKVNYKKFEELVTNKLKDHPEIQCVAMTDKFYDEMCRQNEKLGLKDFRRILGLPICVVENGVVNDYKFVGERIRRI